MQYGVLWAKYQQNPVGYANCNIDCRGSLIFAPAHSLIFQMDDMTMTISQLIFNPIVSPSFKIQTLPVGGPKSIKKQYAAHPPRFHYKTCSLFSIGGLFEREYE